MERIEPHKANLKDDYQRIKSFALQEKQQRVVEEWTNEKIGETYIKVNKNYVVGCTVEERWLNNNKEGL
jgi:peptidyl-prolyl cis-trans isomerase SurA